ncbi:YqaJ viral recombinase family protein [Lysinibacillus irui]|uniref:YqaJ viral recombinase family protein n=1 Tax=Lysinibacillus irui TaxID=2998077 RepID=UPI002AD43162|nr:YqaJ viral recombinase family protein [Lysinibacillus irui]MEA0565137.1 endonuclease [Lysinibacillus irui]
MFQTDDKNVIENRRAFVGGSDVPIILGLSKYKSQFELAKEKTGLVPTVFDSNEYTVYGQVIEPQIRDYINIINETNFKPDTVINKERNIRGNCDGADYDESLLLEIKSHGKNPTMEVYKVQMQLYMNEFNLAAGWLALYERPDNFDAEFDPERLKIEVVHRDDVQINEILQAIELFWKRCEALKRQPEMTEAEYYSITLEEKNEIAIVAGEVEKFELQIQSYKEIESQYKVMKDKLYQLMMDHKVKSFETDRCTITLVLPTESTSIDTKALRESHPRIAKKFEKVTPKKGYTKVSMKKAKEAK